jgi:hypothetical protein
LHAFRRQGLGDSGTYAARRAGNDCRSSAKGAHLSE